MQTAQTRPVPSVRLLIVALAAAALVAIIGLLIVSDAIDPPLVGGSEASSVEVNDSAGPLTGWHRAVDRSAGGATLANAPVTVAEDSIVRTGHRYQMYLAEGLDLTGNPARYLGEDAAPADHSNHRYVDAGIGAERGSENVPENHRIGQTD